MKANNSIRLYIKKACYTFIVFLKRRRSLNALRTFLKNSWFSIPIIEKRHKRYDACMRSRYDYNNKPSIICSNCIGGIIYNNLGLRFLSPTINLWIPNKDFIKFISNLKDYVTVELEYTGRGFEGYPICLLKDITIHFTHYKTFKEAKEKWNERKTRIDYDNLYVIMDENGLGYDDIIDLGSIHCKKLVVFTAKKYPEIDYAYQLKRYEKHIDVGFYIARDLDGFREFEKTFDYVDWLNG